jgi:hypothetical protein
LQDKLDMIWAVLAPDYEEPGLDDDEAPDTSGATNLVQIDTPSRKPS